MSRPIVAIWACGLVAWQAQAQTEAGLKVTIIEGQDAVNNIQRKAATPVVVEVRDGMQHAVPGARIRFTVPNLGPGGSFPDGSRNFTAWTDAKGRAAMTGLIPNEVDGRFSIAVAANLAGREGFGSVTQYNRQFPRNVSAPRVTYSNYTKSETVRSGGSRKLLILAGVGAVVAVSSILAVKGNSGRSSSAVPTTPTSVTIGGVAIGGPR